MTKKENINENIEDSKYSDLSESDNEYNSIEEIESNNTEKLFSILKDRNTKASAEDIMRLLRGGADIDATDVGGNNMFDLAKESKNKEVVRIFNTEFLARNTNKLFEILNSKTPDIEEVRSLLEKGVNINNKDQINLTPLHLAIINGNKEIIKLLIEKGANLTATAINNGYTPIELIKSKGDEYSEIAKLMEDIIDKNTKELFEILSSKDPDMNKAKELLEKGVDVNPTNGLRCDLLNLDAINKYPEIAELLSKAIKLQNEQSMIKSSDEYEIEIREEKKDKSDVGKDEEIVNNLEDLEKKAQNLSNSLSKLQPKTLIINEINSIRDPIEAYNKIIVPALEGVNNINIENNIIINTLTINIKKFKSSYKKIIKYYLINFINKLPEENREKLKNNLSKKGVKEKINELSKSHDIELGSLLIDTLNKENVRTR